MIEDLDLDPLQDLPPELAELDTELRDLRIAERPSFGPELKAELERQWLMGPPRTRDWPTARHLLAASVAVLFLAGLSVPPARASLAELSRQSLRLLGVLEEPSMAALPTPAPVDAPVEAATPIPEIGSPPPDEPTPVVAVGTDEEQVPPPEASRYANLDVTYPELVDRDAEQRAIRRYYPPHLQTAGVGGTVSVKLWVEQDGSVNYVQLFEGSGEAELDRAALFAARELHFVPAMRGDEPLETWVEFDMVFEPVEEERALPTVLPMENPEFPEEINADLSAEWSSDLVVPAPYYLDAQELLRVALGEGDAALERLGPLENVLAGEAPAGVSILRWRAEAADALEEAVARDPDNPAPFLALGRIRTKQGLRSDAKMLFERGLQRANRGSRAVSSFLVAELSYELGKVLETEWLPSKSLGSVPAAALDGVRCSRSGTGGVDDLIALNYLCDEELDRVMGEAFESSPASPHRQEMLAAFQGAVEADPSHVAANLELLLDMADDEQWFEMLNEARRFAWASRGHPYALLLSGLALHRMGRSEEAAEDFALAFRGLPEAEAAEIRDLAPLVGKDAARSYQEMEDEEREGTVQAFWRVLDPILITDVNEREVEHLARGTYAHLRFKGTTTAAGDVWVRYGRPMAVRSLGEGSGLRTEFWDYGLGPDITFQRAATSRDLSLTEEAKAYLEELRRDFPHWYGTRSRSVFALPAQLGRFRGTTEGDAELEIHTEVPAVLATGESDSLSLGLFLLGPGGRRLAEHRQSTRARTSTVRLPAVEATGAEVVVLEFYNPRIAQAAAVRSPVQRGNREGEDPRISDILLVDPAAPSSREISRTDSWVVPRTSPDDASGDAVGLLFELYDLPDSEDPYRMRVSLEPVDGGSARVLAFRPSGQMMYGEEWSRMPTHWTRSTEYVTLDVSDVPPGDYLLRLHLELPDGYEPIEVVREIQRR